MTKHTTNDAPKLCECGCGQPAPIARRTNSKSNAIKGQPVRFISGHNSRMRGWKYEPDPTQDIALCACGCGEPAPIAMRANAELGHVRGEPIRFIVGHHNKIRPRRPAEDRFWEKVDKRGPDECWPWTAASDQHGYGHFWDGEGFSKAHRFAFSLKHGPIPEGIDVLHKCDNPPCCNDAHLFGGTAKDNHNDMVAKGRGSMPPPNQVEGETNGLACYTNAQVREFRRLFAERKTSIRAFATFHEVSYPTMWRILHRITYRHA